MQDHPPTSGLQSEPARQENEANAESIAGSSCESPEPISEKAPLPRPSRYARTGEKIGQRLAAIISVIVLIGALSGSPPPLLLTQSLEDWVKVSKLGYNIYLFVFLAVTNIVFVVFSMGLGHAIGAIQDFLGHSAKRRWFMVASLASLFGVYAIWHHIGYVRDAPLRSARLSYAAERGNVEEASALLADGVDPEHADDRGRRALYFAAGNARDDVAALLIAHGAKIDPKNKLGRTPLYAAAMNGHAGTVRFLLDHGADAKATDKDGDTPLHAAFLVKKTSEPNGAVEATGNTRDVANLLLSRGVDINIRDNDGMTPLFFAAAWSDPDPVEFLLAHGADLNAAEKDGSTALHAAAAYGNVAVVGRLVASGADVNALNKKGDSPLHFAAATGAGSVVALLLAHKADVNAKDFNGRTPLSLAVTYKKMDVAELLRSGGGRE